LTGTFSRLPAGNYLHRPKNVKRRLPVIESLARMVAALRQLPWSYLREFLRFAWRTYKDRPDQFIRVLPYAMLGVHYYRFTFENIVPDLSKLIDRLSIEDRGNGRRSDALH